MTLSMCCATLSGNCDVAQLWAKQQSWRPTVSMGIFLRFLYALQLDKDILLLAGNDELGRNLQDISISRQHATKKM